MICWEGRDSDSGIYQDDWPCYLWGCFKDKDSAQKMADFLNREEESVYDAETEQYSRYYVKAIGVNKDWSQMLGRFNNGKEGGKQ